MFARRIARLAALGFTAFALGLTAGRFAGDRLTRGGPLSRIPTGLLLRADVSTDSRRPYRLGTNVSYFTDEGGTWSRAAA